MCLMCGVFTCKFGVSPILQRHMLQRHVLQGSGAHSLYKSKTPHYIEPWSTCLWSMCLWSMGETPNLQVKTPHMRHMRCCASF
eukprot:gene26430-biopygen16439